MKVFVRTEKRAVEYNAKLKRRCDQTEGHDRRQVTEASWKLKMEPLRYGRFKRCYPSLLPSKGVRNSQSI